MFPAGRSRAASTAVPRGSGGGACAIRPNSSCWSSATGLRNRPSSSPVVTGKEVLEGTAGVALTDLDPRGTVRVRGETWSAESLSTPVPAGATVRVVRVRGVNLVVEPEKELAEHHALGQPRSEGETE